jgi:NRPS condensation-like uncharacterized protein
MKRLPMDQVREAVQVIDEEKYQLHTEQDLANFLANTVNEPIPLDTPQFRMWIVENFTETESAVMFKEHHVMADGIGILEIILLIADEFNPDSMIDFRPTTWFNQMILYIISPLFIFYYLVPILLKRRDKFSITNTRLSGEKKFAVGKKYLIEDLKRSAKELKVSMNDIASAALSVGLAEYLEEKGDPQKGPMSAMIPVNLRTKKVKRASDVELQNNFTLVLLDLMIGEPIEKEVYRISKMMMKAKKSMKPLATMYIQQLIIRCFPAFLTRPLMDFTASKCTLAFSNVPGFRTDLTVNKCKARNMLFFAPTMSTIGLGVSMLSHVDSFKIGVASDKY